MNERVPLQTTLTYYCKTGYSRNADTKKKTDAETTMDVPCLETGEFLYPEEWPVCVDDIECPDPGKCSETLLNH